MYGILSEAVLIIHFLFVLFVIGGFIFILTGYFFHLKSAENFRFRIFHLCAVFFVTAQSWIGRICPLTDLENLLREKAGVSVYKKSFMEYWIEKIIYYDLPFFYFIIAYSLFLVLIIVFLFIYPPQKKTNN